MLVTGPGLRTWLVFQRTLSPLTFVMLLIPKKSLVFEPPVTVSVQ